MVSEDHAEANRSSTLFPPATRAVAIFTGIYMLLSCGGAYTRGNLEFVFYIVVMLLLIGIVAFIHFRIVLSLGVLWCLSLWGLLHMAGGLILVPSSWPTNSDTPVLYNLWLVQDLLKYDQLVHAFGFGATTWLCWQGVQALAEPRGSIEPRLGILTLCAAAGMGFGGLNEVIEFFATLLIPETNVGGYMNTGWDLVANLVGCVIAVLLIRFFDQHRGGLESPLNRL